MMALPRFKPFILELYEVCQSFGVTPCHFLWNSEVDAHTDYVFARTVWQIHREWQAKEVKKEVDSAKRKGGN